MSQNLNLTLLIYEICINGGVPHKVDRNSTLAGGTRPEADDRTDSDERQLDVGSLSFTPPQTTAINPHVTLQSRFTWHSVDKEGKKIKAQGILALPFFRMVLTRFLTQKKASWLAGCQAPPGPASLPHYPNNKEKSTDSRPRGAGFLLADSAAVMFSTAVRQAPPSAQVRM